MDLRQLTEHLTVSPQITPDDLRPIAEAGFTTVICNRPDAENPTALHAEFMAAKARELGLEFHYLPISHQGMSPDQIAKQAELVAQSAGPVVAYCRSGTRCTYLWALGQAGKKQVAEILSVAASAGYDLSGIAPMLGGNG
ncbi:MAG: TIGR01244 family phosphatase [Rhodobacterales bacterium]|nr:MAG: TIGR01244 family phosphatase [Rhodobacterales bacterium]